MDKRALLIVDGTSDGRLFGRLIDFDREWQPEDGSDPVRRDFLDVEVRLELPKKDRNRTWVAQGEIEDTASERERRFAILCEAAEKSSLVRLECARGLFDPKTGIGYLAVADAVLVGDPADAEALQRLPRELPPVDTEYVIWRSRWDVPFVRHAARLADPAWIPGKPGCPNVLGACEFEGEVLADEARHQPDEAIVLVLDKDHAQLLASHGAYLFYADGTEARDAGMRHLPEEPGVYYVKGRPWGYGPDRDGEYDSGFDVVDFEPATAAHYALFGATEQTYAEDVACYREEHADMYGAGAAPAA